jgi:hypothetical protein
VEDEVDLKAFFALFRKLDVMPVEALLRPFADLWSWK